MPRVDPFASALAAHVLVAIALVLSHGHDNDVGDVLVTLAVPVAAMGIWSTRTAVYDVRDRLRTERPAWLVALASAVSLVFVDPGIYLREQPRSEIRIALGLAGAAIIASYAFDLRGGRISPVLYKVRSASLLAIALGLFAWLLHASPAPKIDVWVVHQQGAAAFLHGQQVYAPGAIDTPDSHSFARAIDSYAYPPLNLILTAVAYAFTGETRWAQAIAILVGAFLVRQTAARCLEGARSPLPDLLMAGLLFHPRGLFVLEQAWGEPLALPFLAGFAMAATAGHRRAAAVLLGLLIALKQHLVLYLPAVVLVPGIGLSGAAIALATVVATYAPFAVGAPVGLWHAVVLHHVKNPFRGDSLSLSALLSNMGVTLPAWAGFASAAACSALVFGVPRRLGPLLLAAALPFLLFYDLGRQAFCNYYYLLSATWLVAASALARD